VWQDELENQINDTLDEFNSDVTEREPEGRYTLRSGKARMVIRTLGERGDFLIWLKQ